MTLARDENKRWRCAECGEISLESDLLSAPNPFNPGTMILACPACRSVAGSELIEVCDEPGCSDEATCGFPAGEEFGGYRRTCWTHADWDAA